MAVIQARKCMLLSFIVFILGTYPKNAEFQGAKEDNTVISNIWKRVHEWTRQMDLNLQGH